MHLSCNAVHMDENLNVLLQCCTVVLKMLKIKYQTGRQQSGWTSTKSHMSPRGSERKKNNSMDQTAKICQDTKVYSENLKRREAVYSYCMAAI